MLWAGLDVVDQLVDMSFPKYATFLIKALQKPDHLLGVFGKTQIALHDVAILHHGITCSLVPKLAVIEFAIIKRVTIEVDNLLAELLTLKMHVR